MNSLRNVIQKNKQYYPDFNLLIESINNPFFRLAVDPWYRRYVVRAGDDSSEMRFAIMEYESSMELLGDVNEGSYFYDLIGEIDPSDYPGDTLLGFSILFDLILQDTVEEVPIIWNTYIKNCLAIENIEYNPSPNGSIYFFDPEYNLDLISNQIVELWEVPDEIGLYNSGLMTVRQLKAAIDSSMINVFDQTLISLDYFEKEIAPTNEDIQELIFSLQSVENITAYFEGVSDFDEVEIRLMSDSTLEDIIEFLYQNGIIEEIMTLSDALAKVYYRNNDFDVIRVNIYL